MSLLSLMLLGPSGGMSGLGGTDKQPEGLESADVTVCFESLEGFAARLKTLVRRNQDVLDVRSGRSLLTSCGFGASFAFSFCHVSHPFSVGVSPVDTKRGEVVEVVSLKGALFIQNLCAAVG